MISITTRERIHNKFKRVKMGQSSKWNNSIPEREKGRVATII